MDKSPVILKGSKSGIELTLDPEMDFPDLLEAVKEKFSSGSHFLGTAQVALSFKGRDLSEDEEACILQTIHANSDLDVVCLVDPDKMKEEMYSKALNDRLAELNNNMNEKLMAMNANSGQFFKGNLRSGQVLEFDTSVVILGDINAGAQVVSTGNVVILGALNGNVYAGASGRTNSFIFALKMNPLQIRIADVIARSSDEKTDPPKDPQIAYLENNTIYVDSLSKSSLADIHI
mgnify:CR=1 FL=1